MLAKNIIRHVVLWLTRKLVYFFYSLSNVLPEANESYKTSSNWWHKSIIYNSNIINICSTNSVFFCANLANILWLLEGEILYVHHRYWLKSYFVYQKKKKVRLGSKKVWEELFYGFNEIVDKYKINVILLNISMRF